MQQGWMKLNKGKIYTLKLKVEEMAKDVKIISVRS